MGCIFRCCCKCCLKDVAEYEPLIDHQKSIHDYNQTNDQKIIAEEYVIPQKTQNIAEFNDYDDIININTNILLIFGFIRIVQATLPNTVHFTIPQSIINLICNYHQIATKSVYKLEYTYTRGCNSMKVSAESVAMNVRNIFLNGSSLFFTTINDHIYVRGSNSTGKLGIVSEIRGSSSSKYDGDIYKPETNTFFQKNKFRLVSSSSVGAHHCFVVTVNNKIYVFGQNKSCAFGINPPVTNSYTLPTYSRKNIEVFWPTYVPINKYKITDIRLGDDHSLLLTETGHVLGAGNNSDGQLALKGKKIARITLIEALLDDIITKIRCGQHFSLVLTDSGQLKSFGSNLHGQLGIGHTNTSQGINSVQYRTLSSFVETIECGNAFVCCLDGNGKAYCWGNNEYGQCGTTNNDNAGFLLFNSIFKRPSSIFTANKVTHIGCSSEFTILMDNELSLYAFGKDWYDGKIRYIHKVKYEEYKHLVGNLRVVDLHVGGVSWSDSVFLSVLNH